MLFAGPKDANMTARGWFVGPLTATAALVVMGFVSLGVYASGGGLFVAAGVAFWAGAGMAGIAEPPDGL